MTTYAHEYSPLLDDVLTAPEAAALYHLTTAAVRMALRRGALAGRKAPLNGQGSTVWLILRADAERLWGYRRG